MIRRPPRSTPFPTRRSSDLIRGDRLVGRTAADIANFEGAAASQRSLYAEIPRHRIGLLDVRVHAVDRHAIEESEFRLMSNFLVGSWGQQVVWQRVSKRDGAGCE